MFLMVMLSGQWMSSSSLSSLCHYVITSSRVSGSGVTEPMLTPEVGDAGSGLITQSRSWHQQRQTNNHHGYEKSQDWLSGRIRCCGVKTNQKIRKIVKKCCKSQQTIKGENGRYFHSLLFAFPWSSAWRVTKLFLGLLGASLLWLENVSFKVRCRAVFIFLLKINQSIKVVLSILYRVSQKKRSFVFKGS